MQKPFRCKNCVMVSTRPRINFDSRGYCSACQWAEKKKNIDWNIREKSLRNLIKKHKKNNNSYDCVVAVSGGKDGSYVSFQLKNKYKLNPLTVTIRPPTETDIGKINLSNFVKSGYENVFISPNEEAMQKLNKLGLIEMGFPYYGWLVGVHTAVIRTAVSYGISLIFYSEDGEVEYGGDQKYMNNGVYPIEYMKSAYLEGGYEKILKLSKLSEKKLFWYLFPSHKELKNLNLDVTHYGFYENWDPYRNYIVAKKFCGLTENINPNKGTYTNFAQNDQKLYALHAYFMFLKYGFGRTTQDAAIDIRREALSREQAIKLVDMYDNFYPENFFDSYCDYYKMTKAAFTKNIDRWANKKILKKIKGKWELKDDFR